MSEKKPDAKVITQEPSIVDWYRNNKAVFNIVAGAFVVFIGSTAIIDRWRAEHDRTEEISDQRSTLLIQRKQTEAWAKHAYKGFACWQNSKTYSEDSELCAGEALLRADEDQNSRLASLEILAAEIARQQRAYCEILLKADLVDTCAALP